MKKISIFCIAVVLGIVFVSKTYSLEKEIITVKLPAIIAVAYNPKIDTSDEESNVVFDDFSFYLSSSIKKLEPFGVNFYTVEKQKVSFKFLKKTDSINLAKEDALVGYVFISTDGKVVKRFHVLTDIEIVEMAKKHFKLKGLK